MKSTKLEDLLKDGFSKKFATYYLDLAQKEEQNATYDVNYVKWAHEHGFLAESAYAYGLNEENYLNYLSDYDFYKVWPLNNWTRIWINDKLTLKYILGEEKYKNFMPKYYFYSTTDGLKILNDYPYERNSDIVVFESFKKVLSDVKEFACKPCNGTTSLGFFKLSLYDDKYYLNDKIITEVEIEQIINSHPNYIFTEYIRPSVEFSKYSPMIHTLRLVTLNTNGENPEIIGGYLRIPNSESGAANYVILNEENCDKFNIFLSVDIKTGEYTNAKLTFLNCVKNVEKHPDTGIKLNGKIKNYEKLKDIVLDIAKKFNTLTYMGFDIGITDDGFKCMEINSHPGIKYMQIFDSLYANKKTKSFFKERIDEIDRLSQEEKYVRNGIIR